jgi:hypothetical protein
VTKTNRFPADPRAGRELSLRTFSCLIALLLHCGCIFAVTTETGSIRGFLYGTEPNCAYDNWVTHVSEGQVSSLNIYAPWDEQNNDFGDFVLPDSIAMRYWGAVMTEFLALRLDDAQTLLDQCGYPFEVVRFQDTDSGRNLYLIREYLNGDVDTNGTENTSDDEIGSFDFGWGLYIYDPSASRPIVVTAVHPCDDYPSPVFALEAFLRLDARFLLINGAGREVAYTEPYYSNNASLSDPSRNPVHPYNVAYQRCCDQIRGLTGKTEFSLQIHSYDWNKYPGQPNVMLSAGNGRNFPALPIRDDSRSELDIINHTPFTVHPANSIGENSQVDITDYYSVYYSNSVPVYYHQDDEEILIPQNRDLPGAEFNQQMLYTGTQNIYDVFSPFLHVEMDELPKNYIRNEANWRWFFGYEAETQTWNTAQRYTRFIEYYTPWLDALLQVIDPMLALDDGTGPSNPENLRLTSLGTDDLTFAWDRSYCYDFDSYIIYLRYQQDGNEVSQVFDRNTNPDLAWQNTDSYTLTVDSSYRLIYLRIQATDKHGNCSPYSNELKVSLLETDFTDLDAAAGDNRVRLDFAFTHSTELGFNIIRSSGNAPFQPLASWQSDPSLQYHGSGHYSWTDNTAHNGIIYHYQVSAVFPGNDEYYCWQTLTASPFRSYWLSLGNTEYGFTDTLRVGMNFLSQTGQDAYDVVQDNVSSALELCTQHEAGGNTLSQDIIYPFDPINTEKTWNIKYRCGFNDTSLSLSADHALLSTGADLLIYDVEGDIWHDLRAEPYVWQNYGTGWKNLQLHWGLQLPKVQLPPEADTFARVGDALSINWQVVNGWHVSALDVYLVTERDSLLIAEDLSGHQTTLNYTADRPLSGARLLFILHCIDETQVLQYSLQHINISPVSLIYQLPPGFSFLSFPVSGFNFGIGDLLGDNATAFTLSGEGNWQQTQNLVNGQGYLLRVSQQSQLNLPAPSPSNVVVLPLQPGWNLIPNPLCRDFDLKDIYFSLGSIQKSYAQMVADSLISPRILLLGEDGLTTSDWLPYGKAGGLKYLSAQPATVIFDPYHYSDTDIDWQDKWNVNLSITDSSGSVDAIQMGSADQSSAGFDPLYDLPKPPALPGAAFSLALLQDDLQTGVSRLLQSEDKGLYPDYNPVSKIWSFRLQVNELCPLRIALDAQLLPPDYSVEISLDSQDIFLGSGESFWFDPPHTGMFEGSVNIRSYSSAGHYEYDKSALAVYPNPFRDKVSIDCSTLQGKHLRVSLFNLRGQLVREVFSGTLSGRNATLNWDGKDAHASLVSSGIYFLRIESDGIVMSRKILKL